MSNRAGGGGSQKQNGGATGKRPRAQKPDVIILDDDDATMQEAPKSRRSSSRLVAKREKEKQEKRTSGSENDTETASGRLKKKTDPKKVDKPRTKRKRSVVTKERPAKKVKMRTAMEASNATMRQIGRVARARLVTDISGEDGYLVHPDFRLQRDSFDGKNHTLGIARHDRDGIDNVLNNAPYTTDTLQHMYVSEVSSNHLCFRMPL